MKALLDLHTHTIASGHAYSTWSENVRSAKERGLLAVGMSEHAPTLPGACHEMYFRNFKVLPRQMGDMRIYNGIEANIMDYEGNIDVSDEILPRLDYVIASLHTMCLPGGTVSQNMAAYIGAMRNPYVKIIGHPDDGRYPIDYEELTQAAKAEHVALELNNSSLNPRCSRKGGPENIRMLLQKCMEHGTMIIMGTDSHYCGDVGRFDESLKLLEELQFPQELVVNADIGRLAYVLNKV